MTLLRLLNHYLFTTSNQSIKILKDLEVVQKILVISKKDFAGKLSNRMKLHGLCVLTIYKKKKNGWKLLWLSKELLLFSPNLINSLKDQQPLTWDQLQPMFSNINKLDPMEKISLQKLIKHLDHYSPNGEIFKIGLLVLFHVVEVLKLYIEFVFLELILHLLHVLDKLF